MKVLVLSQHYWPESFRITEVVESLRRAGCSVTVLTGQPNYPGGEVFAGYRAGSLGSERHPTGYTIHRVPLSPRGNGSALRLVVNYVSFLLSAALLGPWALRHESFDVIFVYGTSPILQAIPAILLKRIKRAALVTWVQDLWPQSLEVTGFVRSRRLLDLPLQRLAPGAVEGVHSDRRGNVGWHYRRVPPESIGAIVVDTRALR
jgi:Glycosyl transferase 4-like domain